ncbi:twin-arginine translocation signal domain-containing protein [Ottowia sp.]|nr:twin-arginine translocation signal domain-containing protein [Ottowia sp.]MBK6744936.1 twin-arginine translocation signal domain-containing protein [Ottowia sp.]
MPDNTHTSRRSVLAGAAALLAAAPCGNSPAWLTNPSA